MTPLRRATGAECPRPQVACLEPTCALRPLDKQLRALQLDTRYPAPSPSLCLLTMATANRPCCPCPPGHNYVYTADMSACVRLPASTCKSHLLPLLPTGRAVLHQQQLELELLPAVPPMQAVSVDTLLTATAAAAAVAPEQAQVLALAQAPVQVSRPCCGEAARALRCQAQEQRCRPRPLQPLQLLQAL